MARPVVSRIDPDLVAALVQSQALREIEPGLYEMICGRVDGTSTRHRWSSAAGDLDPWPADEPPAIWRPLGYLQEETAIVLVGARAGLEVASLLFHADAQGKLWRRPNLPGALTDAVPLVLPETARDLASEWLLEDEHPDRLVEEIRAMGASRAYLVLPSKSPGGLQWAGFTVEYFAGHAFDSARREGLDLVPVLLPGQLPLLDLLDGSQGRARVHGLAAVLAYCGVMAHALRQEDNQPEGESP